MENERGWKFDIDREEPVEDLVKKVRFELNSTEQKELIGRLLVHLEEPIDLLEKYADYISMLEKKGGRLNATRKDCWERVKKEVELKR
jgi:hypothetical protein